MCRKVINEIVGKLEKRQGKPVQLDHNFHRYLTISSHDHALLRCFPRNLGDKTVANPAKNQEDKHLLGTAGTAANAIETSIVNPRAFGDRNSC